jgi:hypothetical protein
MGRAQGQRISSTGGGGTLAAIRACSVGQSGSVPNDSSNPVPKSGS